MRKVIYGINLTADGCCDHTKFSGSEEIQEYFADLMKDVDLIVYGRKTYQLMGPYWPEIAKDQSATKSEQDFAQTFNAIHKVVFSRSLAQVEENTTLISANLREEFLKLKQATGKNISVGGLNLPAQLIALGLVDEFYFVVHPIIVGPGRRLFEDISLANSLNLTLQDSKTLQSGCVALHYLKIIPKQ
ncbi:dihydrofolate reductase [Pedobacter sp. PACM 27299]|uniref:dihydrofolate reductase family protein n=1 Tax=Pedobacter sp. PACM 27299 TaxID=1727164 RepID=UPI00070611A9|nr:dihydrofolate reductase family protein [Pedobacter sp. PACM 27299]ALL06862.1 dihydrofolate reductase [Pedobacter sp. PACM 27299]